MKSKEQAQSNIWADVLSQRTWRAAVSFCSSVGLFLLLSNMAHANLSNVSATSLSSADGGTDTTSPFSFTVSYIIQTNSNARATGVMLEYDDGNGYQALVTCSSSGLPTGNIRSGKSGTLEMGDISQPGLPAGTYGLRITVYTRNGNSTSGGCDNTPNVATISNFTITGTNSAPVAVADAGAVNEDATLDVAASGVLGNDTDVDSNDILAVSAIRTGSETGSGTSGSLGSALTGAYGDVTMNADGSYAYIANNAAALAAGAQVTDTFTYTVTDGNITDTAEIVITITGTNDPPFATDDASAVDEDDTLSIAATGLLANDTDADAGASLSITAIRTGAESGSGTAGSIGVALAGAYGDFTVNADGSYSYNANNANALAAGTTATDTFTYTVSDGTITDTAEIVITVTGVNDPPVLTGDLAAPIDEGDTYNLTTTDLFYTDSDDDNAGVTFTVSNLDSALTLTVNGSAASTFTGTQLAAAGQVTFTHDGAEGDTVTFAVNVEDGNEDSSAPSNSTFTFTITDVNDPPVLTGDLAAPIDEGGTYNLTTTDLFYTDSDDDNAGVTFTVSNLDSALTLTVNGSAASTFTGTQLAAGQVTFTHDGAEGDTVTFAVNVEDGNEDSSAPSNSTFTFTVVEVAPSLDHYAISLSSNSASTCGVLAITVTAHNASDGEVATDHNVTLGVSISGPTWNETGSGTIGLTFNGNSVSANLISSAAISNLQVTLTDTTNNAIGIRGSESPTFAFTNAGSSLSFTGPGNLTAGLNNTAPTATIAVTTPADCTAAGTGTLSTAFYFGCLDPTSCVDGQDLTINNQAVSSSSGSPTSVSLGFTNGTSAPFEVNYEDVGQVQLAAAVTIAATGDNPAHTVTGSTTFVSKPADFILALDSNSASGGFKAAGEAFTIGTTATNLDGNTTPNYGAETTPETLTASFVSLVAPSDGANGSLSPGTYTHAGSGVGSLAGVTYSETGTINLQVGTDSDYLGTGSQINSSAVTTGRFYPSYFTLGSNQVIDSCSSGNFTYQGTGASVSYIVTAKNAADVTTSNYTNGASNLASFSLVAEAVADDGSDYTTRLTQSASSSWNAGVYTLSNTTVAFSRSATPESSYSVDIGLKAIDTSDSVNFSSLDMNAAASGCGAACDAIDLSGNPKLRWGRLSLSSASGSEYQSLPLPLVTEYYNGSSFITNTDDGCTTIARSKIEFNNVPISPPSDLTVDIGSGSNNSAGSSSNVDLTSTDLVLVTGDGNLVFSAPSDNDRGSFTVDVDLTDLPWLKYDWDLDGSHDDSPPTATGTFGVFGGHDKILFRKPSN